MEIVRMTIDDVDSVTAIDNACFTVPWSRSSFIDEMNNKLAVYFLAKHEGKEIGYCGFWNVSGEGDIMNIAVLPEYRRLGAASRMIEEMVRCAISLGLTVLTLEVRESNYAAQNLYEKYGFKKLGVRKRYYSDNREDAWIMTKELRV
jgi:ribosomal-protein-alanine N-acetyltransferase